MRDRDGGGPEFEPLLRAAGEGDEAARDRLVGLLYEDLRRAAAGLMRRERADHTLQPSALVNEAVLRVLGGDALRTATDRRMLYGAMVRAMMQVLVDHHRRRAAARRGGPWRRHALDDVLDRVAGAGGTRFPELHEAIDALANVDARACAAVTFHIFLGMTLPEVAEALGIALSTAEADWRFARAWLGDRLRADETP